MIQTFSLMALQKALNHALSLDESRRSKIQALHGKRLEIIVSPLNIHFFMCFQHTEIQLLSHHNQPPDTVIHTSPLGLIRLSLLPASKVRSLFNDSIKLSGDLELGEQVKRLFDELDIDWEGHLAHFTGDVVAHQIGSFFRQGIAFKRHLNTSVTQNITSYLQDECRLFPPREEINDFFHDVDDIVLRMERLSAHINQLLTQHERH
jgi:ubiquinone biosynthesis accessory factor UbiJ